jgi:glycerophosphoryl diester phosphodiesterase
VGRRAAPLPPLRHRVAVIAHRAGKALAPENTLAAIRNAIARRVDYVELDVRATRDGQLVIMHDRTVDRTTDGTGAVRDLAVDEIRKLDAGVKFDPRFMGERVPTFDEALALCKNRVHVYVDHKEAPTQQVYGAIRSHGMERAVIVYNDPMDLKEWKRIAPGIPVMPSLPDEFRCPGGIGDFLKMLPAEVLDGHMDEWTGELVTEAHTSGAMVYVDVMGATDDETGYREALGYGVDGIQTDDPGRLLKFLASAVSPR